MESRLDLGISGWPHTVVCMASQILTRPEVGGARLLGLPSLVFDESWSAFCSRWT